MHTDRSGSLLGDEEAAVVQKIRYIEGKIRNNEGKTRYVSAKNGAEAVLKFCYRRWSGLVRAGAGKEGEGSVGQGRVLEGWVGVEAGKTCVLLR